MSKPHDSGPVYLIAKPDGEWSREGGELCAYAAKPEGDTTIFPGETLVPMVRAELLVEALAALALSEARNGQFRAESVARLTERRVEITEVAEERDELSDILTELCQFGVGSMLMPEVLARRIVEVTLKRVERREKAKSTGGQST